MKNNFHFQKDHYKTSRGGRSHLLEIFCAKCENKLFYYQKDGPGPLKRMYLDRIINSGSLKNQKFSIKKVSDLMCPACHDLLGMAIVYKKESRPAYRLFVEAINKKVVSIKNTKQILDKPE